MRRSGMKHLSEIVKTWRMRLAGHIPRQPEITPANVAMNWIPEDGKRPRGTPQKSWHTTLTEDLQGLGATWRRARIIGNDVRHGGILLPDVMRTGGTKS